MDTYKGESPAKKLARLSFWTKAGRVLGHERLKSSKHLVLASREGGDIGALLALGVPPENILAVEINKEAHSKVQEKFPEVKVHLGDVRELAKRHKLKFTSVFLDLCSPINQKTSGLVLDVLRYCKDECLFGVGFLVGREKNRDVRDHIGVKKDFITEELAQLVKGKDEVSEIEKLSSATSRVWELSEILVQEGFRRFNVAPTTLLIKVLPKRKQSKQRGAYGHLFRQRGQGQEQQRFLQAVQETLVGILA